MRTFALAAISAAALLAGGMATQASAGMITVTFTGTVTSSTIQIVANGTPGHGISPGPAAAGTAATLSISWDPSIGSYSNAGPLQDVLEGSEFGSIVAGSAYFQYGNTTLSILGDYETGGAQAASGSVGLNEILDLAKDDESANDPFTDTTRTVQDLGEAYVSNDTGIPGLTTDPNVPFSYNTQPGDTAQGIYQFSDTAINDRTGTYSSYYVETVNFSIANVTVVSDVPEPATWTMMLIGFGGVGFAMRRHRARSA